VSILCITIILSFSHIGICIAIQTEFYEKFMLMFISILSGVWGQLNVLEGFSVNIVGYSDFDST
jgi:hypothetical protein